VARNAQWAEESPGKGVVFVDPTEFNKGIEVAREKYTQAALDSPPAGVEDGEAFAEELNGLVSDWDKAAADLEIKSGSPTTEEGWIELYSSVSDIDWDAYKETMHEFLDRYRP
jgi:hypothetical protein